VPSREIQRVISNKLFLDSYNFQMTDLYTKALKTGLMIKKYTKPAV